MESLATTMASREYWRLQLMLVACTAAYLVANATWWLQPILIDQLIASRGFTASAAGFVVSAEMTVMALVAITLAKVLKTGRFLMLGIIGVLIALVGSFISLKATSLASLALARSAAGLGEGITLMLANTGMVYFPDPDRAFGKMGTANVIFGVLLVRSLTIFPIPSNGFVTLFAALCLLAPIMLLMPPGIRLRAEDPASSTAMKDLALGARWRIAMLSTSTFIVGAASGVMWTFYAIIGRRTGLQEASVDGAIAVAILTAVPASALAALIGNRYGRMMPVSVAMALMTAAIVVLSFHPNVLAFRVATCINMGVLYFMLPYFFGAGSAQDPGGRGATFVSSAFFLTGAVSPYLGGILLERVGTEVVGVAAILTSAIAWWMFSYVNRRTPIRG